MVPSWSSSLSAFSQLQQQRTSGFLIDEYGNEHDPEHCRFKTLATTPHRHSRGSTSSSSSTSSGRSLRSSSTDSISSNDSRPSSPSTSSYRSLPIHRRRQLEHSHTLPTLLPTTTSRAAQSCWTTLGKTTKKHHQHKHSSPTMTTSSSDRSRSSWTKTILSHLRPNSMDVPPSPPATYDSHHAAHPIFSLPPPPPDNTITKMIKTDKLCCNSLNSTNNLHHHHYHLSTIRKRLELVKLEVRFGMLRTRKRVLGVWKQQTATCSKKP
ncbi:hypothetical protein PSTG_12686 [Puccinia striiformis f. sp. tritici PST-78]|uniref:Uncharacterized protein n=1 Tax=Puccinia striiformis f. sp. tritici PST-78 TaxID=1165861 RepID=A0A0L0V402_9BASI|nr:hypothetical protein PSTG_12686 [Puccinia striiformis f. sp. tritici PST-78]